MTFTRRAFIATALAATAAPARAAGTLTTGGTAFGSYWRLTVPAGIDPSPLSARIRRIVEEVDLAFSPYRPDSVLTRINRSEATELRLTGDVLALAALSLDMASDTRGAFDPTVGPLVARYGFGPIAGDRVGSWEGLSITGSTLRRAAGLTLDFCGIAKGYALDLIRSFALGLGYDSALLDLGGEVAAIGLHPDQRPWRIAIDGTRMAFEPGARAVATSGLTAQSYRVGDRTYGHIIDPRLSRPAQGAMHSVSVFDANAARADAHATALFALGPEAGPETADRLGIDAVFLMPDRESPHPVFTGRAETWRI